MRRRGLDSTLMSKGVDVVTDIFKTFGKKAALTVGVAAAAGTVFNGTLGSLLNSVTGIFGRTASSVQRVGNLLESAEAQMQGYVDMIGLLSKIQGLFPNWKLMDEMIQYRQGKISDLQEHMKQNKLGVYDDSNEVNASALAAVAGAGGLYLFRNKIGKFLGMGGGSTPAPSGHGPKGGNGGNPIPGGGSRGNHGSKTTGLDYQERLKAQDMPTAAGNSNGPTSGLKTASAANALDDVAEASAKKPGFVRAAWNKVGPVGRASVITLALGTAFSLSAAADTPENGVTTSENTNNMNDGSSYVGRAGNELLDKDSYKIESTAGNIGNIANAAVYGAVDSVSYVGSAVYANTIGLFDDEVSTSGTYQAVKADVVDVAWDKTVGLPDLSGQWAQAASFVGGIVAPVGVAGLTFKAARAAGASIKASQRVQAVVNYGPMLTN